MKLFKLLGLTALILSAVFSTAYAQEHDYVDVDIQVDHEKIARMAEAFQGMEINNGKISKEQEDKILAVLPPETKSRMDEIKRLNEKKYNRLLRSLRFLSSTVSMEFPGGYMNPGSGKKKDVKKEKLLEIDVQFLALKYKNSDDGSKLKIKEELASVLSTLFDIREAKKQEEIKRLEKRLEKLKESLDAREINKDIIIERRMQELFGNSDYLEW